MQAGDLLGGQDPERNAMLEQLRRSFYAPPVGGDDELTALNDAKRLGLQLDLPLCRWSFNLLPHHRAALNVHQPQYTLLFEGLLTRPRPWLYFHVLLPGGVSNLDNPEYALEPGSKAPLTGTLMEVVAVQREADSRLSLIVQGLARGIVARPTQMLPFARADVQLLPDDEALLHSARRARRFLAAAPGALSLARSKDGVQRRLTMAAAIAEEEHWWEYENANLTLSQHQTLSQVNFSVARAVAQGETTAVDAALSGAPMAPAVCYREATRTDDMMEEADGASDGEAEGEEEDDLYAGCEPVLSALTEAVDAANAAGEAMAAAAELFGADEAEAELAEVELELAESEEAEEEAEAARALLSLEHQVWLELDNLLRSLAKLRGPTGTTPVPSQLLGLLPPPPEGGWPKEFEEEGLGNSAAQLRERYVNALKEGEELGVARFYSYIPVDEEHFPPRRRAQRLSYAVWAIIGGEGVELQPLLDVQSTSDRLRFALLRCREVVKMLGEGKA